MGYRRRDGSATQPEAFDQAHPHAAGVVMPLHHGQLEQVARRLGHDAAVAGRDLLD